MEIFTPAFWTRAWIGDRSCDTYAVHKGFSTVSYWEKASATYNKDKKEVRDKRLAQALAMLRERGLLYPGMRVLDIGCGPGLMAKELAQEGANVTAMDFSPGMLDRCRNEIPKNLLSRIELVEADFFDVDIAEQGFEKAFDLVVAFMSPAVATPESFDRMMRCAKKGCAIRGWAARQQADILLDLWTKIMARPLEDKPQSILYKINYLFSLGFFPDIRFDTVSWEQTAELEQEIASQTAFFTRVSDLPEEILEKTIRDYLTPLDHGRGIVKRSRGLTATAVFRMEPLFYM